MKKLGLFFISIIYATTCICQTSELIGTWKGTLNVQGMSLRVVFHISEKDASLVTTMDSPDQNVKGIPSQSTILLGKEIQIKMPAIGAEYKGIVEKDTIKGTLLQSGMNIPLDLSKGKNEIEPEKKAVIPNPNADKYTSTDINFENKQANIKLAGTVTYPKEKKNCPAVILLTGSGAQDRDESFFGQKPFLRIADRLSSNGIAVLRFDDRGFAQSEGDLKTATTYDFVTDALAAFEFMKSYPGIDNKKIGFIGHSEGANIAAMAASENKEISFILMLGGMMIPGDSILCLQSAAIAKASGANDSVVEWDYKMRTGIYDIVKKESDNVKATEKIKAHVNSLPGLTDDQKQGLVRAFIQGVFSPWMRAFLSYDPTPYLAKVNCPATAFFGEKDLQVPSKENIGALTNMVNKNKKKNYSIVTIPNVNHMFQDAQTGLMNEYNNLEKPFMNDETLDNIHDWILNYLAR